MGKRITVTSETSIITRVIVNTGNRLQFRKLISGIDSAPPLFQLMSK